MHVYSSTLVALLAVGLVSLAAAEQPRDAANSDVVSSRHLHPVTLVQTLDVLRDGRRAHRKKSKQQLLDDPLRHLRRVQEEDGKTTTCEAALAEAEENLAAYEEKEEEEEEEVPNYLYVQMADQCIFQTTDSGNSVLKSRHFHGETVKFSDRPFTYEE